MYSDYDDVPRNPMGYVLLTLACGVLGMVIVFALSDLSLVAVILGAVGMVIGGFAINVANRFPTNDRIKYVAIAAVGIMTSVMAFMFGFVNFLS